MKVDKTSTHFHDERACSRDVHENIEPVGFRSGEEIIIDDELSEPGSIINTDYTIGAAVVCCE